MFSFLEQTKHWGRRRQKEGGGGGYSLSVRYKCVQDRFGVTQPCKIVCAIGNLRCRLLINIENNFYE